MTTFDSIVFDVTSQSPQNLAYGLSGANNSVVFRAGGTLGGKTVVGLLYNDVSTASTVTTTLSIVPAITFQVHGASYHGQTAALLFDDRSTTIFQIVTASGAGPTNITPRVSASNGFDGHGPNHRRLQALGFK